MMRRRVKELACATVIALVATQGCKQDVPPPLPAALITVETNVAIPRAASRLRIDIFSETGVWLESRDYPRSRPEDWPASFGVLSRDESRPRDVLVRLRAYPEGAVRDYLGERYQDNAPFTPVKYAKSLAELCRDAPELPPLEERMFRRGPERIVDSICELPVQTGSVAAKIIIKSSGRYRFEIVRANPFAIGTFGLRKICTSTSGEICGDYVDRADGKFFQLISDLNPGTYTMVTGGIPWGAAGDLSLRWGLESDWGPDVTPAPIPKIDVPSAEAIAAAAAALPRLIAKDGRDITPSREPHPSSTIDRLIRVHLVPGEQIDVHAKLDIGCSGRMAHLVLQDDGSGSVNAAASTSCGDDALPAEEFHEEPCDAASEPLTLNGGAVVCVPGGTFALGGAEQDVEGLLPETTTLPVRMVGISRFAMDRYEFTVGRYRQTLAAGFVLDGLQPAGSADQERQEDSTYSPTPRGKETYPLNNVPYALTRKLCAFYGGDLPTEAQWEYAALAAGRAGKSTFPWGEAPVTCERAVLSLLTTLGECAAPNRPVEPRAVDGPEMSLDVNALGIVGMAGNVSELVRDWLASFDSPCWRATSPIDPECIDPSGPLRSVHGGSFVSPLHFARSAQRSPTPSVSRGSSDEGFRCVYPAAGPSRTWVGP